MNMETVVLCTFYLVAGICTIRTLTRYKMYVAAVAYTVAFFVLWLYLPVFAGNNLVHRVLDEHSVIADSEAARSAFGSAMRVALARLKLPLFIATLVSVFLCLSAVSVAVSAIRAVRRFCRARKTGHIGSARVLRKIGIRHRIPTVCKFCHTFCRYNC